MSREIEIDVSEIVEKLISNDPNYKHIYLFPEQGLRVNVDFFITLNGHIVYQITLLDSVGDLTDVKCDVLIDLQDAIERVSEYLTARGFTVTYAEV